MTVLLVTGHFGQPPEVFAAAIRSGAVRPLRDQVLDAEAIRGADGIVAEMHIDQIALAERAEALTGFFDRGGRLAFMGHLMCPFLPGLATYRPNPSGRRADYALTRLAEHPILAGIALSELEVRRGVAGFYGRGHVPPPDGAVAVTGVGPERVPVDWEWARPAGGRLFLHAGNDLWISGEPETNRLIADRLVAWAAGTLP